MNYKYLLREFLFENYSIGELMDSSPYKNYIYESGKKDLRALDIGYGSGQDVFYLLKKGFKVVGIEKDQFEQDFLNKRFAKDTDFRDLKLELIIGDFLTHQFDKNQKFSVIILGNVLHFYKEKDWLIFLQKCKYLLKDNGVIYLRGHHTDHPEPKYKNGMKISEKKLQLILDKLGLNTIFYRKTKRNFSMEEKRINKKLKNQKNIHIPLEKNQYVQVEYILKTKNF